MTRARIIGVGAYAPKRVLTNADLEKMVATSDEWIVQRTGIRQRHIADESEATSDLAVKAAQQALERANLVPEDIEFIAVGTTTPDMIFPTVGNIVQHRLGCRRAGDKIRIEVWDSGVGIAEDDLNRIFDPFFSTGKKGTGLGLWVTQDIVRQHGGRIEVSSEIGRGTVFSIVLQVESPILEDLENESKQSPK